jgi:hypothetical protein
MSEEIDLLRMQLENPMARQYDPTSKHSGGYTPGRKGTIMDLAPPAALEVLRAAIYDPAALQVGKTPQLWGYKDGVIYNFKWDNVGAWHGYPVEVKPPNAVLQEWLRSGTISRPAYGKILGYPNSGF